ncbi:MAG: hypothetical protein ACXWK6_09465 [Myxococcaceae bacterium]
MRVRWTLAGAAAAALLSLHCGEDLEKPSQLLERVRLLALRADPPEVNLTDGGLPPPITFEPLAYPDGGLTFRLALCGPGNPFAADYACPGANGLDLPDLVLDASRPEVQAFLQSAFGTMQAIDGGINVGEPGVAQVALGYELARADGGTDPASHERGIYRMSVRFSGPPNHNPELLDVTLPDGGPLQGAVLPLNQEIRLYPHIPDGGPGGIETFTGLDGGIQYERLNYAWASTAGEVVDYRSAEPMPDDPNATSDIRFRTHETPTPVQFYVVLRDLRGGVSWRVFDATIGP